MFDRVNAALNAANLLDKYKSSFIQKEVTDDVVDSSLQNRKDLFLFLNEVIPVVGHRMKFVSEFRKTGAIQKQQQQQEKMPADSRSSEIVLLDEDEVSGSLTTSSLTTTTTTQVNIEQHLSSPPCSYVSTKNPTTAAATRTDFTTVLKTASDESVKLYMSKMNELLSAPGFFLDESALLEKHEETQSNAIEHFSSSYQEYKNSMSQVKIKSEDGEILEFAMKMEKENDECFHVQMSDLHDEIQKRFEECQPKNELKKSYYISKANNFASEAEKLYTSKMKEFVENCSNQDELKEKEKQVNEQVMQNFNNNIQNPQAKSEFISQLNEELQQSINKWFQDQMELFRLRREEDQVVVNRAFDSAKKYYDAEMEKETNSKDFIEPDELLKLDKKVLEQALKICDGLKLTFGQEKELKEALGGIFKKYQEKNLLRRPNINISPAIGIDLGTTNSCVAIYRNGKVEVIHNETGNKTTPSFVSFQDDGSVVVGDVAKELSYLNAQSTVFDAKRLIGRNFEDEKVQENVKMWPFKVVKEDESHRPKIQVVLKKPQNLDCPPPEKKRKTGNSNKNDLVETKTYHCEEISALVLRKMKKIAEGYLGVDVKDAVITVPALFNDYQRQATRDAGEIAGLNVLRLINEPTAASIAYNLHRTDDLQKNVLVFDLGGGTLDVVVLQISKGEITVKSVHGDTHLGGQDFDSELVKYCIDSFKNQHGIDLARDQQSKKAEERSDTSSRLRRIRIECEKQKKVLSFNTKPIIIGINYIESKPKLLDLHVPLTREKFEQLNQKHFDRCLEIVQLALAEAKMNKDDIDDVVLVGGSTRIPKIQKMLSDFFGGKTLCKSINPDQVVAEGAAIQACILSGQGIGEMEEIKLNDVTPFSIGISVRMNKLMDRFSVVIPKNTVVPCEQTQLYCSLLEHDHRSCQRNVAIRIFEGEDEVASKNNLIGRFLLENVPVKIKKAEEKVEDVKVTMKINTEGILHVRAECTKNGESNEILIKTLNKRMTRKEIEDAKVSLNSLME